MNEHVATHRIEGASELPERGLVAPLPEHSPEADRLAAWMAEYGVVLNIPPTRSAGPDTASDGQVRACTDEGEPASAAPPATRPEPDAALLLRLSAQKLWAERNNPIWLRCSSWLGTWVTDDRISWRTTDGAWLAQLERSTNGRHVSLAFYQRGTYAGRQDATGFHHAGRQSRARRPRPVARSLPLPLAG
jgi:hypothetical protein